jgi:hypothetical protein
MGRNKNTMSTAVNEAPAQLVSGEKPANVVVESKAPVTPPPTLAPETPLEDNDKVNKSADARRASAALNGETSPTKIVAWLKEQGVAWAQPEDAAKKHSGLITSGLSVGKAKKSVAADMDLDTILARLEQVRGFAQQHNGKDNLLAMIANAAEVEKMAEMVGGLENLSKFAAKV